MMLARSHRRPRPWVVAVLVLALAAAACSIEDSLPAPSCLQGGSVFIVAQSVPGADLVPCLDPLPTGWEVESVKINQDGSVIRLDSDRAGSGAAVLRFAESCDSGEAVLVRVQDGWERFDFIESSEPGEPGSLRGQRFFKFAGGCVWWDFDFVGTDESVVLFRLALELADTLTLYTRDSLNESIRENFIDEEL
jgi:hypothetical protein